MNQLFYGDNLQVLREHVAAELVDLIYLAPLRERPAMAKRGELASTTHIAESPSRRDACAPRSSPPTAPR